MSTKAKIVLASLVWLVILAVGVSTWRLIIHPIRLEEEKKVAKQQADQTIAATSGNSRYAHELTLGLDSFSGYAILRSDEFAKQLASRGIRLKIEDDEANYVKRAGALEKGDLQFAVFPADAMLKTFARQDYPAATIVALIDETRGADAMLAYKSRYPDVDKLNNADVRFVLVGSSPSETLAQVVIQDFGLSQLSPKAIDTVDSPEALLARYRNSKPSTNEVFVTWEPFVSQLRQNPEVHVLVDSSRVTGYIIDTLVVNRDFLLKNGSVVESVLESYFTALYAYRDETKLVELLLDDAKKTKQELTKEQAKQLVRGIQWKNTQENFAHFGKRSGAVVHVEDMLVRIAGVLTRSGALPSDAFHGKWNQLFFDRPIENLLSRNFHPGLASETVREDAKLASLNDEQWSQLVTVGTLSVPELVFLRGSSTLTEQSKKTLEDLAQRLQAWPQYYLIVRGNASTVGDLEANRQLALKRGEAAKNYLLNLGTQSERVRVEAGEPTGQTRVTFQVGQTPF